MRGLVRGCRTFVVGLAVVLSGCFALGGQVSGAKSRAQAGQAGVVISLGSKTSGLPRSFLGFSLEYRELPDFENNLPLFESLLSQLTVQGDGPLILRIGGDVADQTYWHVRPRDIPSGSFVLTNSWWRGAQRLVSDLGLRVIVDLNLKAKKPHMAAAVARTALAKFTPARIVGWEVGNEPDRYGHGYSSSDYIHDFTSYAQVVGPIRPHIPMMGPASTSTSTNYGWLAAMTSARPPHFGILTGHRYPYSNCSHRGQPLYPTIARVLGEGSASIMAQSVAPAVQLAHNAHLPFRLDEFNSVTCGGRRGVSNTFATALWAPDAIFELLKTGADGINMHIRFSTINGPFKLSATGVTARPLLYGLMLFVRTIGPSGRVLALHVSHAPATLKVWAVRTPLNGLRLLLINKGRQPAHVTLHLPPNDGVSVQRLLAPGVTATSGVTLAGQTIGTDGTWQGTQVVDAVPQTASGYKLDVPKLSAALVLAHLHS